MPGDECRLRDLARTRAGVVSVEEALGAGFTHRTIRTRTDRGSWMRLGRVLIIRDLHRADDAATAWVIHLHTGLQSAVSGPVAMRLQGWDVPGADHLALNPSDRRASIDLDLRVLRRQSPDIVTLQGLPPLAPRLDALIDTLINRSAGGSRDLLDLALQRRWIGPADLDVAVAKRAGVGSRGQRRLRDLSARAASGSRSEAEQRMGALLRRTSGNWTANYAVRDDAGRVLAEIDFADPGLMIAIEVDGRAFHSDRRSFERDRERQNMLILRGWMVLRFTWERIVKDPAGVIAEIEAVTALARAR